MRLVWSILDTNNDFVWFFSKVGLLDLNRFTSEALTALALFVAISEPRDREKIVGVIMMMLEVGRGSPGGLGGAWGYYIRKWKVNSRKFVK